MNMRSTVLKTALMFTFLFGASANADQPAQATINLVATVPNTCSLVVKGTIDSLVLGEAIRSESLERFQVPLQVECNTPNAKLRAMPIGLTSPAAPGYSIYYHVNTSIGLTTGAGWINTAWQQPGLMALFTEPVKREVMVLLEGFKEDKGRALPAGNYSGYIRLTLGAE